MSVLASIVVLLLLMALGAPLDEWARIIPPWCALPAADSHTQLYTANLSPGLASISAPSLAGNLYIWHPLTGRYGSVRPV